MGPCKEEKKFLVELQCNKGLGGAEWRGKKSRQRTKILRFM